MDNKPPNETIQKDLEVWFPEKKLKLKSGDVLELPKLSWGRESRAIKTLLAIVNQTPELKNLVFDSSNTGQIMALLPQWIERFSDKVAEIVSYLTDKDPKWVEDNLETEDVFNILGPFFKRLSSVIRQVIAKVPLPGQTSTLPASSTSSPESTGGQ